MKNGFLKTLLVLVPVLFVVNVAVLAMPYLSDRSPAAAPDTVSESSVFTEVSATDIVSGGNVTVTPIVSEADVPEVVLTSLAGTPTAASIDEIAEEYHCTGLTVAVIKDGQVAYHYEVGHPDVKRKRELNKDTKFRIASLSKVYTSMMGMKLAEDGTVDLDGDVGDVFGYKVRNPYSKKTPITLRMLLSHTSSIRDRSKYIFSSDIRYDVQDRDSYFSSTPGTRFAYSNLGMGIAGALIEQATGMQLTEYSNKAFLDGMEIDAVFNGAMLKDKDNVADCILGGSLERSAQKLVESHGDKEPGKNHTVAAGGLIISAVDYAKIMTLLINEGSYKGVSYLSPETVAAMHETQIECADFDQCIGIRRSDKVLSDRTVYYHTGAAYGIFSLAIYDLTDKSGVVVFTTGSYASSNSIGIKKSCLYTAEAVYRDIIGGTTSASDLTEN